MSFVPGRIGLFALLLALVPSGSGAVAAALASGPSPTAPSPGLRQSLERVCGCHEGSTDHAVAAAVSIFDLHDPDWIVGLTKEQRSSALRRFEGKDVPDGHKAELARLLQPG